MKNIKISVITKKDKNFYIGYIKNLKFIENRKVEDLNEIKKIKNYMTFSKYLKEKSLPSSFEKTFLKNLNVDKIFVLNVPINPSKKEFEDYWWENYNKKCLKCKRNCKQSFKTEIIKCPNFKPK
jgi:hypothetical protein